LAIRIYVTTSGRTIKLHTENNHLSQIITTFSTGLTSLNGITAQVQNLATGTTGSDFAINSSGSTHTFNLPTASAANRGALSTADWTTFNSKQAALGFTPENAANKQNSLAIDGTGVKFPTVDALNSYGITVDLIDALTVDFALGYSYKINSVTNVTNAPTTTILDDGVTYTLGATIAANSVMKVTVSTAARVQLNITRL
jgi:hypothetical protein